MDCQEELEKKFNLNLSYPLHDPTELCECRLMLYLFLGSTLLGSLSTAILLWRKSVVETALAKSQASDKDSQERANRAVEELGARSKAYEDQLARQRDQVDQLRKERDIALDALAKNLGTGSVAELLRLRNVPQVSSDSKST